jgi:hypothetical protein
VKLHAARLMSCQVNFRSGPRSETGNGRCCQRPREPGSEGRKTEETKTKTRGEIPCRTIPVGHEAPTIFIYMSERENQLRNGKIREKGKEKKLSKYTVPSVRALRTWPRC